MLNRAGQLETDLREEQAAWRRERADGLLRRFADLVLYNVRIRRIESTLRLGAGRRPSNVAGVSTEGQYGTNKGERGKTGDDPGSGSDSDDSHQSRLCGEGLRIKKTATARPASGGGTSCPRPARGTKGRSRRPPAPQGPLGQGPLRWESMTGP